MSIINQQLFAVSQDPNLTDSERSQHIETYVQTFKDLTQAVIDGAMHLVLMGDAGQGKTQTVTDLLEASGKSFDDIKGSASAIGLYRMLHDNQHLDVLVIDDCDTMFENPECANILKAAMDSKAERKISWEKQGNNLAALGLPNSFTSTVQIILITNHDLVHTAGRLRKKQELMKPVIDRSIPFKTGMPNRQWEADYFRMMHENDLLLAFKEEGLTTEQQDEIMQFVLDNAQSWKAMTFRMLGHIARFYKSNKTTWQSMSLMTL